MSKKRPRDQARSDGDNTLVHKHNKASEGSVAVEDKENYNNEEFLSSIKLIIGGSVTELVGRMLPGLVERMLPELVERMLPGLVERMLPGLVQQFLPEIVEGSQHYACKKQQYGKQVDKSASRSLQLNFKNKPSLPIFTNKKVEGEDSSNLTLELVDAATSQVVNSGPESSMEVEIVVLNGDFKCNEDDNWEPEYFRSNIVSERKRKGKKNLLTGSVLLTLKNGVGVAHDIKITDNSKWIPSGEFRLGARVEKGYFGGMRVKEAVTEQFVVREDRGKYYEKHYPPSLGDEVWRLENICKKGVFRDRLRNENISTLKVFLTMLHMDPQKLRRILGSGMTAKKWEVTKNHAETCDIGTEMCVYYSKDVSEMGVVFDIVRKAKGLLNKGEFTPMNDLLDDRKEDMLRIVKDAYENPEEIVPYTTEAIHGSSLSMPVDSFICGSKRLENSTISDYQDSGGLRSTIPKLGNNVPIDHFTCHSARLEIPTFSNCQYSERLCSLQPDSAFPTSMASSDNYILQEAGGGELKNNVGPADNTNGPIFGSSSNVPVDTVPSPSPRPEIPTVPNQQYYELKDSEWQIPFTTSTSILEDYNVESTEGMEFGEVGHLIYGDQDVLTKSWNGLFTSSGSNCSEFPTDVSSILPNTGVNNLDDVVYMKTP